MKTQLGFWSVPQFSRDPLVAGAFWALVCYLLLGRSFAQIGIPAMNVFLGEVLLVLMFLDARVRQTFNDAVSWLTRPGPFHVLAWTLMLFLMFGVLELMLGMRAGYPVLEAAKNLAFNYYAILIVTGIAVGTAMPRFLDHLAFVLPRLNPVIVIVLLPFRNIVRIPISATPEITAGAASAVAIALLLTYHRPGHMRTGLLAVNTFCLLFLQVRGDWLGVALGVLLWAFLNRRWRALAAAGFAALLLVSLVAAIDLRIPGAPDRGGSVSADEIFARAVAPVDPELAARFSDEAAFFEGTVSWRTNWWSSIWKSVHVDDAHALFGHGYGYPLAGLADFLEGADAPLRTPHSVFYYALGYTGWLGVAVFGLLQLVLLRLLLKVRLLTGNPFGPMLWVLGMSAALFGNFFETPFNAMPFWFLVGVVVAPLLRPTPDATQTRGRSRSHYRQGPTEATTAR